jgi:glutamate dehydrogenase
VYFDGADPSDLAFLDAADRAGAARAHRQLGATRPPGVAAVRVSNPTRATDGWASPHTVIEIVTDDMPFIVDSINAYLARAGFEVYLLLHPVIDGESYVHLEIPRESDHTALERLHDALEDVLADVRVAVTDWDAMRERARASAGRLRRSPPDTGDRDDISEAVAFLEWLVDDHFTFVGACERAGGEPLGIARRRVPAGMPGIDGRSQALTITKALERSTVHRAVPLDVVAVKRFDEHGAIVGEDRFLGLYAADVYSDSVADVPVVRRRAAAVLARAGFAPRSHDRRALLHVLETFPRDEVFRLSDDELFATAMGIMQLGERRRVRLFANRDPWGRFISCLVYLPRDRYTTPVRVAMLDVLRRAYHGMEVDFTALVGESVLAQLRVVVQTARPADVDDSAVEAQLASIARAWTDELRDALIAARGEEAGLDAWNRWADAFPLAYQADVAPSDATSALEVLEAGDDLAIRVVRAPRNGTVPRLELYHVGEPLLLSDVMAVLEYLDVVVVDERPYTITPPAGPPRHVYSFGVRPASGDALAEPDVQPRLTELFLGVWAGTIENDALNRLVLRAGLDAHDVVVLRALVKYLHQAGTRFTEASFADALAANPRAAQLLVELFALRFDPALADATRHQRSSELAADLGREIDAVTSLDEDRILRGLLELVLALVRTNAYAGKAAGHLAMKVDPSSLTRLPLPRPRHEIWVYSPRVEGVHLRAGDIARGGIRWSDRRDDFRTEVLGLMKAQTEKNAVIVPVGAKGGFVVKSAPAADVSPTEVEACYRTFVGALLDLTDNLVEGRVVPPASVVRHDGDDTYLVVAADKGTARFSDVANSIAAEHGYWLGDAFASGGSAGYDHKAMGITSRGAWVSVRAHFRAIGVDADTAPLTVVGIGDMSGDVFGNGMLRSPHIKLIAAFDHRHVFVDPDPDPAASFRERARLFALPSSSWADYDPSLLSTGGGVYPRGAKTCALSPEARRVLALEADADTLTPDDVVTAILRAPVDLLFNGGIGTFVKASAESHADAADRANDAVRVDAVDLRCKVVAEGGNLGLTQLARVEYALTPSASRGGARGRVNTDAIDNSAGVDCSDHEVNIKILLRAGVDSGRISMNERNELLVAMTDEVAALVLADNEAQTNALEIAAVEAYDYVGVHARQIERLEQSGVLDRALEDLPTAKALQERHAAGVGLTAPELAVLLAFTKLDLQRALIASDVPDDPYLRDELLAYFPSAVRERFADLVERHELRREIVATVVANAVVNRAGISYVSRLSDETGADLPRLARAHVAARDVFGMVELWTAVDALDLRVPAATQDALFLVVRRVVERAARWLTRHGGPLDLTTVVSQYRDAIQSLLDRAPELALGDAARAFAERTERLVAEGIPASLARRVAALELSTDALPIAAVSEATGAAIDEVARVQFTLGARLRLDWLRARIAELPRGDRWQIEARAGLRDDVADLHRTLTEAVLAATPGDADATARVEQWIARHADATARAEGVLSDIETAGTYDLATLGAARRELRDLVDLSRSA